MDPRWQRPHPSELSPLHQLWILPKMHVCPCFLLAPVFVGLEKNLFWSGRTCRTPTGLVRFVYAGDRSARCRIMPRSVKPVIPYSTAMLCASIVRRTRHRYRTDEGGQIFWSNDENYRRKVGGRSCSITLMGSMRWICSSCRQSRFACSMDCRSWGTADDKFYGLAS